MLNNLLRTFKRLKMSKMTFPKNVVAIRIKPIDAGVMDEWYRDLPDHFNDFHSVRALKLKRKLNSWQLIYGASVMMREEPWASQLATTIHTAILKVGGVKNVIRGAHDSFAVTGNVNGGELVRTVSKAIDRFMHTHLKKWKARTGFIADECKKQECKKKADNPELDLVSSI